LGFLWGVLDMNNECKGLVVNLSALANVTNVELKLKPDFIYLKVIFQIQFNFQIQTKNKEIIY
jgi:hypothetical protein